jgi:hypothetical protein
MTWKYANKRLAYRNRGRFAKPPSLEEMGMPINKSDEPLACENCGRQCHPILAVGWHCICGHVNGGQNQ